MTLCQVNNPHWNGRCTVCMAQDENPEAIEWLEHWLSLSKQFIEVESLRERGVYTGTSNRTVYASFTTPEHPPDAEATQDV